MPDQGGKAGKVGKKEEPGKRLRIAAVGDLHVHKVHHGELRPMFAEISDRADVLCLCGDLTNLGLPEEADHLAADLSALRIPAVAVLGNHDHHSGRAEEVRVALRRANVALLGEDETFTMDGVGFAGVKGFGGGFASHMLDPFGEEISKLFVTEAVNEALALEHALKSLKTPRRVVVLHYSPIEATVRGEPEPIYPFLGCSRLAETIDRYDVAAVFHGHAHRGAHEGRTLRGAPVYNCSMDVLKRERGRAYTVVEI